MIEDKEPYSAAQGGETMTAEEFVAALKLLAQGPDTYAKIVVSPGQVEACVRGSYGLHAYWGYSTADPVEAFAAAFAQYRAATETGQEEAE